jgi:hypothetical protein
MADDVETPDPKISNTLYDQMWELWVGPAVEEHGSDLTPDTLRKVVVELPPGGPVSVRLNDEAAIEASFTSTRPIEAGEDVYLEDIAELHGVKPIGLGENSGWICFFRMPDGRTSIAFDFTYNRARARMLLDRSAEFLVTAQEKAETSSLAVCLDSAFSAAELAVQVEMLVMQQETDNHKVRGKWLAGWSENGNSPKEHANTLWQLADLRKRARYGSDPVNLKPGQLSKLLDVVEDMLEHAKARVEPPGQGPDSENS